MILARLEEFGAGFAALHWLDQLSLVVAFLIVAAAVALVSHDLFVALGVRRWQRQRRDLRLHRDVARLQSRVDAYRRMFCPKCHVRSLTTDTICPFCFVALIPLNEAPPAFKHLDPHIGIDAARDERRASVREMQTHSGPRRI